MPSIKTAILGFGTVGEGVYRILQERKEEIKAQTGYDIDIQAILVKDLQKERLPTPGTIVTNDVQHIFKNQDIELVFEAIVGEEPAFTYLSQAIDQGCDVITANKSMFAVHGETLIEKAKQKGVHIGYEATTAGGVPIIRTIQNLIAGDKVQKVQAILNGTSNYILTKMREDDRSFKEALEQAQALGYAEVDPTDDITGMDAFRKLMILSALCFGKQPDWSTIEREGIDKLTHEHIIQATQNQLRYRHIAELTILDDGQLQGSVRPILIGPQHPFYTIDGVDNSIMLETAYLGQLTLTGPGAGMYPTGSAMVNDFVHIIQQPKKTLIA